MKKRYGVKQDIFSDMKNGMKTPELWEKYSWLKHSYIRKLRCEFNKAMGVKTTPIISGKDNPRVVTIEDDPFISGMKGLIELGKDIFHHNPSNSIPEEKKNDVRREDVKPSPEKKTEIVPIGKEGPIKPLYRKRLNNDR